MKQYQIRVNDREYHVEIEDLTARPVRVKVGGDWFEVWPHDASVEHRPVPNDPPRPEAEKHPHAGRTSTEMGSAAPPVNGNGRMVKSPLPGVVTAVHIQPGEEIAAGQPLCVIEAMKMNNVVRASQNGKVNAVRVTVGQHVKHHDVLVELA